MAGEEATRSPTPAPHSGAGVAVAIEAPPSGEAAGTGELLATLDRTVGALGAQPLSEAVDAAGLTDSVAQLERLERRLHAEKVRRIGEIEARQAFAGEARSTVELLADRLALTRGEARAHTEAAAALGALPQTAALAADGKLGLGQLHQAARGLGELARHTDDADGTADAALHGLDELVATAGPQQNRSQLRQRIDAYLDDTVPEALRDREQRAWQRRRLTWHTGRDGLLHLDGRLDPTSGAHLTAALEPLARPDSADDPRTTGQRRADALTTLARRHLDSGELPQLAHQRPHVTLITTIDALTDRERADADNPADAESDEPAADRDDRPAAARGEDAPTRPRALLDGVGPVSPATARQLACDAELTDVVVDRNHDVLDVGRAHPHPTTRQWTALAARDRGCIGCHAPVSRCQAHHITYWSHGGPTDLANLCLLCWSCHHRVHHHDWTVTHTTHGGFALQPPTPNHTEPAHHRQPD